MLILKSASHPLEHLTTNKTNKKHQSWIILQANSANIKKNRKFWFYNLPEKENLVLLTHCEFVNKLNLKADMDGTRKQKYKTISFMDINPKVPNKILANGPAMY